MSSTTIHRAVAASWVAAVLVTGCGSGAAGQGTGEPPGAGTRGTLTTGGTSPTGVVERCRAAGLRVELGRGNSDMRGRHAPLRFTNTGSRSCTLHGAPGVSYVTGESGGQIGLPAERETGGPLVELGSGETASAPLFLSSAPLKTPDCRRVDVAGLRVFPPDDPEPVFVEQDAIACEPPLDGPFLEVGAVRPGADNTRS
ncbi:MAG: DUF4232 domain-containing protein [Saccharothrix sp.]|nr:DUF4232 domain-containing protein [Saccharothrix sp.]